MQLLSNSQRTKDLAIELSEFSRKPNHFDDGINCIAFQVIVPEGCFFLEVEKTDCKFGGFGKFFLSVHPLFLESKYCLHVKLMLHTLDIKAVCQLKSLEVSFFEDEYACYSEQPMFHNLQL